jgi:3-dehydroquinate synthase
LNKQTLNVGNNKTLINFLPLQDLLTLNTRSVLAVFDNNTRKLFPENIPVEELVLEPGEITKNWDSVKQILTRALSMGLARDSLFVGIGGGVICDMTAFAASIYMRGIDVILIPTTLLAMSDAALGGKTGIDFHSYKNIIGTFAPASEVRICIDLLKSLPDREYMNGLGEIIKHGLLRDKEILSILDNKYEFVIRRDQTVLRELVERSIAVKSWYVEQDAKESGIRAHLNLGHTFGHALESVSGFKGISHGEAVVWGIIKALKTGLMLSKTDSEWLTEVVSLVDKYSYDLKTPKHINPEDIIAALKKDKKKKGDAVQFVLQHNQGDTFLSNIDDNILLSVLTKY